MSWPTATTIAARVASGAVSATEVVRDALDRIARHNGVLGAFTDVVAERALARAAAKPAGPLAGVPFAVKNLFDIAGLPTRAGSAINRTRTPAAAGSPLSRRRAAAGAMAEG